MTNTPFALTWQSGPSHRGRFRKSSLSQPFYVPLELNTDDDNLWAIVKGLLDIPTVVIGASVSGPNSELRAKISQR